jgi:hypothetical protein
MKLFVSPQLMSHHVNDGVNGGECRHLWCPFDKQSQRHRTLKNIRALLMTPMATNPGKAVYVMNGVEYHGHRSGVLYVKYVNYISRPTNQKTDVLTAPPSIIQTPPSQTRLQSREHPTFELIFVARAYVLGSFRTCVLKAAILAMFLGYC